MSWFKKKPDPISDRAQELNHEIARLESKIQALDSKLHRNSSGPRLRSTVLPHDAVPAAPKKPEPPPVHEPIFETVKPVVNIPPEADTPDHYNELGVRKYDFNAMMKRLRNHFRGPSASNPRLVSYLASGGIQGLQPLRYERRVARNRFIAFVIFLLLILIGTLVVFLKHH